VEGEIPLYYSHKDVSKLEHLMRDKSLNYIEREIRNTANKCEKQWLHYAESSVLQA
jgi:hypothetical protein